MVGDVLQAPVPGAICAPPFPLFSSSKALPLLSPTPPPQVCPCCSCLMLSLVPAQGSISAYPLGWRPLSPPLQPAEFNIHCLPGQGMPRGIKHGSSLGSKLPTLGSSHCHARWQWHKRDSSPHSVLLVWLALHSPRYTEVHYSSKGVCYFPKKMASGVSLCHFLVAYTERGTHWVTGHRASHGAHICSVTNVPVLPGEETLAFEGCP